MINRILTDLERQFIETGIDAGITECNTYLERYFYILSDKAYFRDLKTGLLRNDFEQEPITNVYELSKFYFVNRDMINIALNRDLHPDTLMQLYGNQRALNTIVRYLKKNTLFEEILQVYYNGWDNENIKKHNKRVMPVFRAKTVPA